MRLATALLALIIALGSACGDDDEGGGSATTAPASETASAEPGDGASTPGASPTPSPTPPLIDEDGELSVNHPLVLAIAARYVSQIPPVSLTNPVSCEGINAVYDKASETEKPRIDAENNGRLCILLSQTVLGEESASVVVGYYRSDVLETLDMVQQSGAWVITN